ncbi:putative proline-rich receptor-like protein kinase PERK8 [Iris pallida]|uniref:Proline-rich receptor-like protein kinase PERK8 n=1 Tax=Iris pallida TaxID=29817 RepID=A0AAX6FHQ5_IRIPA|nr:putative proline-rich receptor-like protein kinase PERK8 [Iris pallida]
MGGGSMAEEVTQDGGWWTLDHGTEKYLTVARYMAARGGLRLQKEGLVVERRGGRVARDQAPTVPVAVARSSARQHSGGVKRE